MILYIILQGHELQTKDRQTIVRYRFYYSNKISMFPDESLDRTPPRNLFHKRLFCFACRDHIQRNTEENHRNPSTRIDFIRTSIINDFTNLFRPFGIKPLRGYPWFGRRNCIGRRKFHGTRTRVANLLRNRFLRYVTKVFLWFARYEPCSFTYPTRRRTLYRKITAEDEMLKKKINRKITSIVSRSIDQDHDVEE